MHTSALLGKGWETDSLEVLWEDAERVFCRLSRDAAGGDRYAFLPALSGIEHPGVESINRLAHEYELKDYLDGAWALRPVEFVRERGLAMLVVEYAGGEPLDRLIGRPMEIERFLRIATTLSVALGRVHKRGLIHKDIRPANIIVNSETGQVGLTGFGIATRLLRERQSPEPPEFIAGTLAYMAPEQTGRMNRSMDSRSDLYALGVTFYEMLTGVLPFSASDPMEWMHCHIARKPVPPEAHVKEIPAALSAIVLKLLAKAAEERYQTAAGVASDLQRCLTEWDISGNVEMFPLGARDVSDRLLIPEKLYGREREIETLIAAFDRVVANGTTELVLVSGYSGIGKTAVVNELHKVLVPPRGLFASGKFDQYKRDIPYATLAQAFQSLVRPLLGQSEAELGRWREALREALGANGQLMVSLVPELELVIGAQAPVADLPPQEAKNRFQMVFRRFLSVFAAKEHPLALFLDDLQWLDSATLELFEHLLTHPDVRHLLLVGVYRDNEVGPAHALTRTLETIRAAGARVHEIVLAPLRLDDVAQIIADALHSEPQRARALAELVQEKTLGNPFFTIQFFTALAEEGLLAFDPVVPGWQWDINRIRAKSYTDNVVELMAGKLKRLSTTTQEALKMLACLGNIAESATLAMVRGETNEALRAAFWEAVHTGVVLRQDSAYKFLHDRIQQAAYSLIPEEQRGEMHLRIGRMLLASLTVDELGEQLFDVANQLNRGASLLVDSDEKAQVAMIELRAGRKAKASAACASACVYLGTGMALLGESGWSEQYELTFNTWLERAECEFLAGNFDQAEHLIGVLLLRAASKVDQAAVYHVKIRLHVVKSENPQAVDSAVTCLRLFGVDLPARPTWEQVEVEYDAVWRSLDGRAIEELIDLPLMTDPELQAVMGLLSALRDSAFFADLHLYCLLTCRMVDVSIRHGISSASTQGLANFGIILGAEFHRYKEGYRFARLACDLVEKHDFLAYQARVHNTMGMVAPWTQSIATAFDFTRAAFRAASEAGDLTYICFSMSQTVSTLLLRNDPLDAVWRESETGLELARKAGFHYVYDLIVSQQRFIAAMQGRTASLSTFSDAQFDEVTFEAQMTDKQTNPMVFRYWVLKLKARFLAGDYVDALAAADMAKALLRASSAHFQLLDYFYYTALTVAAVYEGGSDDERNRWADLLSTHREQLREWAENYPATFHDKYALVLAEIARLEGRGADAMRLFEESIQSARDNGFVQNEGVSHEVAARFYAARGVESVAHTYLWNARHCYFRWGALGKVRQLDQHYPRLPKASAPFLLATNVGTPVDQLDVGAVVAASQAVSGEIVLDRLIEALMTLALQHAGAERGLLILPRGDALQIAAEARIERHTVEVTQRQETVRSMQLPESLLHTVIRTQESVILNDASAPNPFSTDEYIRLKRPRSVLCMPLVKQAQLVGVLYLENNLASYVFTPARISLLKLLSSQAAISLENARLYRELAERESRIRRLVDANIIGIFISDIEGRIHEANDAFLRMIGYDREDLVSRSIRWTDLTPPEWLERDQQQLVPELKTTGRLQPFEKEFFRKDGSRVPVLIGVATFEEGGDQAVAFVVDLTERKHAADALREVQTELAHANRLATMGQLAASIAHEVNQPIGAVRNNAHAALRFLVRDTPDLKEVKESLDCIVNDSYRAGNIIGRIRDQVQKVPPRMEGVGLNDALEEVMALLRGELSKHRVSVQLLLAEGLPLVHGDRVQLQQVMLNLVLNAIEAMVSSEDEGRELVISTGPGPSQGVVVAIGDSGPGVAPEDYEKIFGSFHTTKEGGVGIGLSICRSIIDAHEGKLWVDANQPRGAVFRFTLPVHPPLPGPLPRGEREL
ncbi:MAG: AAA family ATPase [Betaproteobacteria bacterium]